MQLLDNHQETKPKKRVFAMAGSSFFKCVRKAIGTLAIIIPVLALSGCGEGDGPTNIPNTAADPLPPLPPGFCDSVNFEIFCDLPEIINFNGGATIIVDNPDPSGINQSDEIGGVLLNQVARMQKFPDQVFGGTKLVLPNGPIDFSLGEAYKVKVWSPRSVVVTFKLEEEGNPSGGFAKDVTHTGGGEWQELCFDLTGQNVPPPVLALTIIFANGTQGAADVDPGNWTFYYDDITQATSCGDFVADPGIVPDVTLYYPAGGSPDLQPGVDYDEVTAFGSGSVINPSYADDNTYGEVLAVTSGTGYDANIGQIGYIGFEPGFVTFYDTLDFKVKGLPNFLLFVTLYEGGERLRINVSSSELAEALDNGWYQVSIPLSNFTGLTTASGIVFESDDTSPMQFTFFLSDIGFGEPDDGGGCDNGGAPDPVAVVFDDDYGDGVGFAPFGGSINDVSVDATEAYSGSASLKVVVPSAEYTGGAMVVDPGRDVSAYDTLTFWAKASDARTLNVAGIGNDGVDTTNATEITNLALTTEWQQFTITIPNPSALTANTGLFHFAEGSDEGVYTIWFDEIIYASSSGGGGCDPGDGGDNGGAPDPVAVVFDDDYGDGVGFAPFGGSINDVSVDATEAYSGSASLKVVVPSAEYTGGAMVVDPGRDVSAYDTLTFWAKASDARTLNVAGIGNDGVDTTNATEITNLALTTEWQQFTITIPNPSALTANTGLFHFAEGSDEGVYTIWFDEIIYANSGGGGGGDPGDSGLVPDGGFEAAGASGLQPPWFVFENGGTVSVSDANSNGGTYSARLQADASSGVASFPILKVERLGAGSLTGGEAVTISFDAIDVDNAGDGKVFVAEFFTERADPPGGATNEVILGGYGLSGAWQTYTFNTNLGADAAGGVSLLFKADCGANPACTMDVFIDNVSIIVP